MALRKPVGLWHICDLVVRDGFLGVLVGLRGAPKQVVGFGRVTNWPGPQSLRKANSTIDYCIIN
jgi:hypothetical protein